MGLIKEYKDFISKGNVIDLAVGVVIGGAFGKIVTSLVNDLIMPPIGILIGGVDFKELKFVLQDAVTNDQGETVTEAVSVNYGMFAQNILEFLIIGLAIFFVVKAINSMKKKEAAAPPPPPPAPTKEETLLTEIRDILKNN